MTMRRLFILSGRALVGLLTIGFILMYWGGSEIEAGCIIEQITCDPCTSQGGTTYSCTVNTEITFKAILQKPLPGQPACAVASTEWLVNGDTKFSGGVAFVFTYTFPVEGTYEVKVIVKDSNGVEVSDVITMEAVPATFTIRITPSEGGSVVGTVGEEDGIDCTVGVEEEKCKEIYQKDQGLHLKVIPNDGWVFLGWRVNGKIVKDEDLIQVLNGTQQP